MISKFITINFSFTVNCNIPPHPTNGFILPYTNTLEGANVTYICGGVPVRATCTKMGKWEPNNTDICTRASKSGKYY